MLRNPCILEVSKAKRGEKIRIGRFTPTFWRPKRGQNCYVTRAFSGERQARGENKNWVTHPYRLWGPQAGGIAT